MREMHIFYVCFWSSSLSTLAAWLAPTVQGLTTVVVSCCAPPSSLVLSETHSVQYFDNNEQSVNKKNKLEKG